MYLIMKKLCVSASLRETLIFPWIKKEDRVCPPGFWLRGEALHDRNEMRLCQNPIAMILSQSSMSRYWNPSFL